MKWEFVKEDIFFKNAKKLKMKKNQIFNFHGSH